jgi:hypothetical protein
MDLKGLFDALYEKLVLRDLFGKVVPGIAFMLCMAMGLCGSDLTGRILRGMPTPLWLSTLGFAWLLGFSFQYFGERIGLLKSHPPPEVDTSPSDSSAGAEPRRTQGGQETSRSSRTPRQEFYTTWAKFHSIADEHEKMHAERVNVIREACGNAAVSVGIGVLIVGVGAFLRHEIGLSRLLPGVGVSLTVAFSLQRMHIEHLKRYGEFLRNTVNNRGRLEEPSGRAASAGSN